MYCAKLRLLWLSIATASIMTLSAQPSASQAIVADHNVIAQFDLISTATFDQVRSNYNIFYGHTSHGSQIMTGISMLAGEDALYSSPTFYEINDDLGHLGDISWVSPTRAYLDSHSECNVVMWSWCGGASDNTETGINTYLNAMAALEVDYPTVTFVYMTGHLDGTGPSGNLYVRNNQIRDYCINNDKILFDFADIESYDPDGTWYPDESDVCNWCADWCAIHDCPYCGSCAHSHCFNCYQKGKAFWYMMAVIEGWSLVLSVDDDTPSNMPEKSSLRQNYPNPFNPSTQISFALSRSSAVKLEVFNSVGQKVRVLFEKHLGSGEHIVSWDGRDQDGEQMGSGVYFYRLQVGDSVQSKKMILLQ